MGASGYPHGIPLSETRAGRGTSSDKICHFHPRFVSISPLYVPASSGTRDNVYVTRSYDATSHFETVTDDVKDVWLRAMKDQLVLKKREELQMAD